VTHYLWVLDRKAEGFPIKLACKVAQVSRQAFCDWRKKRAAGPTNAETVDAVLVAAMRDIEAEFDSTYRQPRMTPELRGCGFCVNHKRVERLMRTNGIAGVHKAPKIRTAIPAEDNPPMPDLVGRRFTPGRPDVAWVGDITYIPTGEGWLSLTSVLDLGSRRWLGYSMAGHMRTELVSDALNMAVSTRCGHVKGTIFHGDRGSQYMSGDYRKLVVGHKMRQSVGRTGMCWDNAVAESAWSSLKRELAHRYRFATRTEARQPSSRGSTATTHADDTPPSATPLPLLGSRTTNQPRPPRPRNQRDRPAGGSSTHSRCCILTTRNRSRRWPQPTSSRPASPGHVPSVSARNSMMSARSGTRSSATSPPAWCTPKRPESTAPS
jgi:putative transposase